MMYGVPVRHKLKKQFDILNEDVRLFDSIKTEEQVNALKEIAEIGSPYDASYIFRLVFSENEVISKNAASTVVTLLVDKRKNNVWFNLYDRFRYVHYFQDKDLKFLEHFPPDLAVHLFGIVSLNHSGYVREKALYYLDSISSSNKLPYILLRLNDWVSVVREKAKEIFETILPKISILDLIKHYRLIEWLGQTTRIDLKDVQNSIYNKICAPENREQLLSEMKQARFKERLFCWKVLRDEIKKDLTLIEKAIQDPAPEIRQWAAGNLPQNELMSTRISQLLYDKAVRVKYAALKAIPKDQWLDYKVFFENAIYDNSRSIREYSRFVLRKISDIDDFSSFYRERLKQNIKPDIGSIMGLAETGNKKDTEILRKFLKDDRSKIRASIFLAFYKLNVEGVENLYIEGLNDAGKPCKACANILSDRLPSDIDRVYEIFKEGNTKTKKAALKVLNAQGQLEALRYILEAMLDENEEIKNLASNYLEQWISRYAVQAWFQFSDKVYEEVMTLWEQVKPSLNGRGDNLDSLLTSLAKR